MPGAVAERIIDAVTSAGAMTFDRFMEFALYDEDVGFFGSGRGSPGKDSDFLTSPEVSGRFGVLIAGWALNTTVDEDAPLVELGAGSGAMLQSLVDAWNGPVYALERSRPARALLAHRFESVHVAADIDDVPAGRGVVVIGNEVLDNMPAALARRSGAGWLEVAVDASAGSLELVEIGARPDVVQWCETMYPEIEIGTLVTVQLAATAWITRLLDRFERVHCCLIDYAATSRVLAHRPAHQVVRGYRKHRAVHEWLASPGATDLTVDVNIDGIVRAVTGTGASVRVLDQHSFLMELGAGEDAGALAADERIAATEGRVMDQLKMRSRRLDLEAVLDPGGFGGFTVFLIESGT